MKRLDQIALELKIIFAGLFETDQQIEELLRNFKGKKPSERHNGSRLLREILDLQGQLCASVKSLTREYKEIIAARAKPAPRQMNSNPPG